MRPLHLLLLNHSFGDNFVNRRLHKTGRNRLRRFSMLLSRFLLGVSEDPWGRNHHSDQSPSLRVLFYPVEV